MERITYSFIVIPGCPYTLLGRDLLTKMGAQIHFDPEKVKVLDKNSPIHVLTLALGEKHKLFPQLAPSLSLLLWPFLAKVPNVWAEKNPIGLAHHQAPVLVKLKGGAPQPKSSNT